MPRKPKQIGWGSERLVFKRDKRGNWFCRKTGQVRTDEEMKREAKHTFHVLRNFKPCVKGNHPLPVSKARRGAPGRNQSHN